MLNQFKKEATFGGLKQIRAWESTLHESIETKYKIYRDMNEERIYGREKKSRDQRRKIWKYAATALSVGASVAGAAGAAGVASLNTLMRR